MHSPICPRNILIIVLVLAVVAFFAWTFYPFDQVARQSERHTYSYSIDLLHDTTMENVTLFIPVPERDHTPLFMESLLNGTAYGVPPDWNLTLVQVNGTPMLAIRADRMVPVYNGYPIRIEPGVSVLPTTLVPGREYSADTPILQPVSIGVMETVTTEIETRTPIGNEPVFFPGGEFTPGLVSIPTGNGLMYDHPVPVYIRYTSGSPVSISLRFSVQGSNMIWNGGWQSNQYSDTVTLEIANNTQGWVMEEGRLSTAAGVYY